MKEGIVDAAAIDQNKNITGEAAFESANPDGPLDTVYPGDLNARGQAQSFRQIGGSGAPDVLLCDDEDGRGCADYGNGRLGNGGDRDVAELFEGEALQTILRRRVGWLGLGRQRGAGE
jgi:hypothetical protein